MDRPIRAPARSPRAGRRAPAAEPGTPPTPVHLTHSRSARPRRSWASPTDRGRVISARVGRAAP